MPAKGKAPAVAPADAHGAGRDGGGGCEGCSGRKGSGRREVGGRCEGGSGCEGCGGREGGSGREGSSGREGRGGCQGGGGCEGRRRCQGDAGYQGRCACGGATCPGSEAARNQGSAGKGRAQGSAQGSAGNVRRLPRQHAVVGDRRRRAGHPCGAWRIDRLAPAQDDQVRGQHHLGNGHQDEHGVRFHGRRRREYGRQLAGERLQPRGPGQHRHGRSRPDRRSRGLPGLRSRRAGRGNPEGRAEEGSAAAGNLSQAAGDPRAAQQAVGVRDGGIRAVRGLQRSGRDMAQGGCAGAPARSQQSDVRRRRRAGCGCASDRDGRKRGTGGKEGDDDGLEFQMDEEISISPTSGATPKTPADILAGAESELEKTAKQHRRHDCGRRRCGRRRDGGRAVCGQVRRGDARGRALPTRSRPRGKASATARNSTSISNSTMPTSLRR